MTPETAYQRQGRQQVERQAAREARRKAEQRASKHKSRCHKSRCDSGSTYANDMRMGEQSDDLGLSHDY